MNANLETKERATYAGLHVEHSPIFRVVLQFTGEGAETANRYIAGGPLETLVELRTVRFTLADLQADELETQAALGGGQQFDLDIDVKGNRVVLGVGSPKELLASVAARGITLPNSVSVVEVDQFASPTINFYGGLHLTDCTSGFTIYYGSQTTNRGVATAGHCGNTSYYNGNLLTYQGDEVRGLSDDEQSFKLAGATYRNWVQDGLYDPTTPYYRVITAKLYRLYQYVGDFVCKYGKTTGYGCGYIVTKSLATSCEPNPRPTYVKVDSDPNGTGFDLSEPGDSGGPFFSGATALGIMACQQGYDAIYVAVDYVESGLVAHILTAP